MYSVPMAIVDMIPVVFYAAAMIILQRDLYNKMSKGAFALFAAGTIDVMIAGFLKAVYKLLYAANVCDFQRLSQMFFPVESIGFVLSGIGMIALMVHPQGKGRLYSAAAPAVFSGTFIFVALMVLGLGATDVVLCILSRKLKKPAIMILLIVSFIGSLMMGYLSSKDFAQSYMNWAAEAVNTVACGTLLIAAHQMHKNGLAELQLEKA